MTQLSDLYNTRIMELAATIPRTARLASPDATATAHSKLCGSTITVDLIVRDGRVVDYGQTVRACLLGQASASVVAREIIGVTPAEFASVAASMRAMLSRGGASPGGRWSVLAVLEPVREVKARHASTLLVFDAVEKALATLAVPEPAAPEPAAAIS
jgi:NifU-like protein involved in Fe-S cluster formation